MWCVHVLLTVALNYEHPSGDLVMLDGSSLSTHLDILNGALAHDGASCMPKELVRSVRCVAKLILHIAPRLTEVRPRRRAGLPHCHHLCWCIRAPCLLKAAASGKHARHHSSCFHAAECRRM